MLDQKFLEKIKVNNGLRQGCTLTPTLFNLYACAVQETWWLLKRVEELIKKQTDA